MSGRNRWLTICVVCFGLLLAACGGAESGTSDSEAANSVVTGSDTGAASSGDTTVRVKENASTGSAPILLAPSEDGPAPRGQGGPTSDVAGVCLNQEEAELARQINEYRASLNLPPLQISKSLSLVAQQHVWDSNNNQASWPTAPAGKSCNLHSWSRVVNPALQQGTWSEVCYTSDHANAAGMWNKPREIAGYPGDGVENSFATGGTANATGALTAWKNSPGHNNVITQQGGWGPMAAMGLGVSGGYAHLWLSGTADPVGEAPLCAGVTVGAPTAVPTAVPPTAVPPTATTEPTAVPPTAVPPTAVPPTAEPTAVPATAEATTAAATAEPTAVPPTAEPTAVPPTAVPPTAVPTDVPPTAVPPTAVPPTAAAPTGEILNENGTIAAGATTQHTFPMTQGLTYTVVVTPSAEFDVDPTYSCTEGSFSFSGGFDWNWEGVAETFNNTAIGDGSCTITIAGYGGSTGTYTIAVTAR